MYRVQILHCKRPQQAPIRGRGDGHITLIEVLGNNKIIKYGNTVRFYGLTSLRKTCSHYIPNTGYFIYERKRKERKAVY